MSAEDLEQYEADLELQLYREYKDVVGIFTYAGAERLDQLRDLAMDCMAQRLSQLEAAGMYVDLHDGSSVELPVDLTSDKNQNK